MALRPEQVIEAKSRLKDKDIERLIDADFPLRPDMPNLPAAGRELVRREEQKLLVVEKQLRAALYMVRASYPAGELRDQLIDKMRDLFDVARSAGVEAVDRVVATLRPQAPGD